MSRQKVNLSSQQTSDTIISHPLVADDFNRKSSANTHIELSLLTTRTGKVGSNDEVRSSSLSIHESSIDNSADNNTLMVIEDSSNQSPDYTWTYGSLKQLTLKPLVEVLFDTSRPSWWLLVLTGMVWGTDDMWRRLRNSTWALSKSGKCQYYMEGDLPLSSATDNPPIVKDSLLKLTITVTFKKYICRTWFILVRLMVIISIIFILFKLFSRVAGQGNHDYDQFNNQLLMFYVTMLIQAITTLATTRLLDRRLYSFAPQYTISAYQPTIKMCYTFLGLALFMEVLFLVDLQVITFVFGFNNFTLMSCLMFILVDVQSSSGLVDHLLKKLDYFETQINPDIDNATNPLLEDGVPNNIHSYGHDGKLEITYKEYELIRKEILQRVNESWYINTFAVTVAGLNVLMLVVAAFSFMRVFPPLTNVQVVVQLGKEIIFLFIVFCYSAAMNAKAETFLKKFGNYVSANNRPMNVWVYATLNPISFKLGGYVATWNSIAVQAASVIAGVVVGFVKTAILSQ